MTVEVTATTVEVLGKTYQLKCQEHERIFLKKAAEYLEEKMREVREVAHVLSVDRIAVLAALNITHQLLSLEQEKQAHLQEVKERLEALDNRLDQALAQTEKVE
jgi:cell division protein ZapA